MLRSKTVGRLAVQLAKALDPVRTLSAQRGDRVVDQLDLPRGENSGMAGQDLLDERCAGSRQSYDEDRELAFQPKAAHPFEEIRRRDPDHPVDEQFVRLGVVLPAVLAPFRQLQCVTPIEVFGSVTILASRVEDFGQAEVQQQSLFVRQVRFLQQPALGGQIILRKFAAQEFRQFEMRQREPPIAA